MTGDEEWKRLYEESLQRNQKLEAELEETKKILQSQIDKNESLQSLVTKFQSFVPKKNLRKTFDDPEEKNLNILQRFFRRRQQTIQFTNLGKFSLFSKKVSKYSNSENSQILKERSNIILELLKTETDYVTSLNHIMNVTLIF
jgi:hypothetical protein